MVAGRTSTQSWDIAGWTRDWRDADGALAPGALGPAGGAWWFRAITDTGRLTGQPGDFSTEPLTSIGARARLAAFVGEANQILVHWPLDALALVAFAMREALAPNEAIAVLVETLPPDQLAPFITWIGATTPDVARRWMTEVTEPDVIVALAKIASDHAHGLERLTALGALGEADRLARQSPLPVRAAWVVASKRPVDVELLVAAIDDSVDDETFAALASRLLRTRDRRVWDALARRPLTALVPRVLELLDDPVAPWVFHYFEAGGDPMLDALLDAALGRGKRAAAALRALSRLDRTLVGLRLERRDEAERAKLLDQLEPHTRDLPELPRTQWSAWMTAVSERVPTPAPAWLNLDELPDLATKSGHRLPRDVQLGIVALLQEVRFEIRSAGQLQSQYDAVLDELPDVLSAASANAFWNALFAMWWTHHRPEVQWVIYAAAFLCDGPAIRDLGAKLRRHRTWFGNLSARVIAALGHNRSRWAVAALDDIARRARTPSHRGLAAAFLDTRAARAGQTTDRYVDAQFPDEDDPLLAEFAAQRLESAMTRGRSWTEFTWHELRSLTPFAAVAPCILWRVETAWDETTVVRTDGEELLDVEDEPHVVDGELTISVAHPAELPDAELDAWNQRFAEYEIVQPFDQLERPRFRAASLSRDGFRSPVGVAIAGRDFLRRAAQLDWQPVRRGAHGEIVGIERRFELLDSTVILRFTEPLEQDGAGESALAAIEFQNGSGESLSAPMVDPIAFSEAHLDIQKLTSPT